MKLFTNANIPTSSAALKRVNVLFDKTIIKISKDPIETEEPVETIDLEGKLLLPGAVDMHCHLLGDMSSYPSRLEDVTRSALKGGWTSLADLSYVADPPLFDAHCLEQILPLIDAHSYCDIALWGHVDIDDYPYHSEAAQELWSKGVVGLLLMNPSINDNISDISYTEIMDLFLDIYDSDTSFAYQGFDVEHSRTFNSGAQLSAIKKLLRRMQENPIHIPRVLDFDVLEFINGVSKRSDISYSLCFSDLMHLLSETDTQNPELPLNFSERITDLLELFRTNKIYTLSNNSGYPEAGSIYAGNPAQLMQYSYLWTLSELWKKRKYTLHSCIKMSSENPAKRLGIYPQKGCLEIDSDADMVIYDASQTTDTGIPTASGESLQLTGAFSSVWLRGQEVYKDGVYLRKGQFLARSNSPKRRHNSITWI